MGFLRWVGWVGARCVTLVLALVICSALVGVWFKTRVVLVLWMGEGLASAGAVWREASRCSARAPFRRTDESGLLCERGVRREGMCIACVMCAGNVDGVVDGCFTRSGVKAGTEL